VTRWSIVRTVPVLLDGGRVSSAIGSVTRMRSQPQLLLVALLAVAFVAIAAARLSSGAPAGPGVVPPRGSAVAAVPPSTAAAGGSASPAASAPPAATPSPTLPLTGATTRTYKVKRGDTLYVVARRFGTSVGVIQRLNHLGSSTNIHAGQVLKLP
jgi:membrane-bound lytic murein transglycosylase D